MLSIYYLFVYLFSPIFIHIYATLKKLVLKIFSFLYNRQKKKNEMSLIQDFNLKSTILTILFICTATDIKIWKSFLSIFVSFFVFFSIRNNILKNPSYRLSLDYTCWLVICKIWFNFYFQSTILKTLLRNKSQKNIGT